MAYQGPYDWPAMRAWLALRAVDGVESVGEAGYARTACVDGIPCVVDVTHVPAQSGFLVGVATRGTVAPTSVAARVVRVLDLDRDLEAMRDRVGHDPWLAGLMARHPGVRVPGGWEPFELGVGPAGGYTKQLEPQRRDTLREACRARLAEPPFVLTAGAWAARGRRR